MEELVLNLPENWKYEHESRIQEEVGFGDGEWDDYTIIPDDSSFFSSIQISYIARHLGADDVAYVWAEDFLDEWDEQDTPKPEVLEFVKKTKIAGCDTYYYVDSYPVIDEARMFLFLDSSCKQVIIVSELRVWDGGKNEAKAIEFLSNALRFK